jgi:DNA-binding response OmpR family regulator
VTTSDLKAHALSVLVIEDQSDVATTLAVFLELSGGHRVRIAADGVAGVRAGLAAPPDAVICDIGLPQKDGFQVARELIAGLARRPLMIAVTGYGEDEMRERGKVAGFDHYLLKPVDPRAIEALLRAHAGRRSEA